MAEATSLLLRFRRAIAGATLMCFGSACNTADYTPQGLDLVLNVSKKLVRNTDGSATLTLSGQSLHNPQGAVETFHQLADKEFGSTPYSYSYNVSRERAKHTVTSVESVPGPPMTAKARAARKAGQDYADYQMGYQLGKGLASGNTGTVVLAAVILVGLLATAAQENDGPTYTTVVHKKEEEYGKPQLILRGTARATTPSTLDHSRTVRILVPTDTTFHGKTATGSGLAAANATAEALSAAGWQTEVVRSSGGGGYLLKPSLIRWADRSEITIDMNKDVSTVEYELQDSGRTLQRFVVHGAQSQFSMKQGARPGDFLKPAFAKRWAVYTR